MTEDKLLTLEQVAEYLQVHRDTVYTLLRSGRLKGFQLGGRKASWRIGENDLRDFLNAQRQEAVKNRVAAES
jgi:excisionase family DNA binding protein